MKKALELAEDEIFEMYQRESDIAGGFGAGLSIVMNMLLRSELNQNWIKARSSAYYLNNNFPLRRFGIY